MELMRAHVGIDNHIYVCLSISICLAFTICSTAVNVTIYMCVCVSQSVTFVSQCVLSFKVLALSVSLSLPVLATAGSDG